MTSISAQLSNAFTEADRSSIEKWWSNLSEAARAETAVLCDERAENCFFGVVADERDHVIPKVHGGRFLPSDDAWGFDEWGPSYFDHLIAHPEVLVWDATQRTFHTGCIGQQSARNCWRNSAAPEDFECQFEADDQCLMRPLRRRRIRWRRMRR